MFNIMSLSRIYSQIKSQGFQYYLNVLVFQMICNARR